MSNSEITFVDGRLSRGRLPGLILRRGGRLRRFCGDTIPGWCAVVHHSHQRNGRWSTTTYRLALANDVEAVRTQQDFDSGEWFAAARTWAEICDALKVQDSPTARADIADLLMGLHTRAVHTEAMLAALNGDGAGERPVVIVSRHPAAIEFCREAASRDFPGSDARVIAGNADIADVHGAIVYGNVPMHLAAAAAEVRAVEFLGSPPRGAEYSAEDMRRAGARLVRYIASRV